MSTSLKLEKGRINCRPRPPTLPGTVEPMPIIASTTLSLGASAARAYESADRLATEAIEVFRKWRRLTGAMAFLRSSFRRWQARHDYTAGRHWEIASLPCASDAPIMLTFRDVSLARSHHGISCRSRKNRPVR